MNPFLTVWLHPKQTARHVIDNKSLGFVFLLIAVGSFAAFGSGYVNTDFNNTFSVAILVLIALFIGPLLGITLTFIYAGVLYLFGKVFGGTGSYWDVFKACSLTYIPSLATGILYYIWMFLSPGSYFSVYETSAFSFIVPIFSFVLGVWGFVINVAALAEAHRFSYWRSFFTLLIPIIMVTIAIIALVVIIGVAFFSIISG
ncbi:MAG: Yip1 family protein [Lysinibacillus sp.]